MNFLRWFRGLANELSDAAFLAFREGTADNLGLPNEGDGPFLPLEEMPTPFKVSLVAGRFYGSSVPNGFFTRLLTQEATYAVATSSSIPIPTPALLPSLLGLGFAAIRK